MGLMTQMYGYSSIGPNGNSVLGGKIVVKKNEKVGINWINMIEG